MPPDTSQGQNVDITSLEMAFAKDPASDAYLSLSEAYLGQGRFMEAMVVCKKGIKSSPESVNGRLLLVRIYSEQGKIPKAIVEVDKLLAEHPDHSVALVLRAALLDKKGDPDEAIALYKKALDLDADNAEAKEALAAKGVDYTPASAAPPVAATPVSVAPASSIVAQAAGSAVGPASTSPAGAQTWTPPAENSTFDGSTFDPNQGLVTAKRRGPGVTLGIVAAGIAILGVFFLWFALHARELRKIDELNRQALELVSKDTSRTLAGAIEKLDEVLKLDAGQPLALGLKSFAMAVRGFEYGYREDREGLGAVLTETKKVDPTSWYYAADLLATLHNGDPEGARKTGKELIEKGFGTVPTYSALASAAVALGDMPFAAEALKKAREKDPASARALVASGNYDRRLLQSSLANAQYNAALKNSPDHAAALVARAFLALENPTARNLYSAYKDWQNVRDIGRGNIGPVIWGRAKAVDAFIARARSKNEDAEQSLKDAIDPRTGGPNDAEVWYMTGRTRLLLSQRDKAIEAFKKSIKLDANFISTHIWLARALTEAGKTADAEKALAQARKLDPDNVEILVSEAISKRKARKYDDAVKLLRKAAKDNEGNVAIALELLDTYQAAGRHKDVTAQFKKIEQQFGEVKSIMSRAAVTLGQSLLRQRDVAAATGAFNAAVEMDSKNADAHFFLGYALKSDKKRRTEAFAAFQKYLELAPQGEYVARAKKYAEQIK